MTVDSVFSSPSEKYGHDSVMLIVCHLHIRKKNFTCWCLHDVVFMCTQLFSEMLTELHSRKDLDEIRDLAKRLAMSFGIDLHRVRKPLVALHTSVRHTSMTNTHGPDVSDRLPVYSVLNLLYFGKTECSFLAQWSSSGSVKETDGTPPTHTSSYSL